VRELLELEELVCWRRAGEGWVVRAREERRGDMAARSFPERIWPGSRSEWVFRSKTGKGFEGVGVGEGVSDSDGGRDSSFEQNWVVARELWTRD
jgi:hypothetical protein